MWNILFQTVYKELMQNQQNKNKYSFGTHFPILPFSASKHSLSELILGVCLHVSLPALFFFLC